MDSTTESESTQETETESVSAIEMDAVDDEPVISATGDTDSWVTTLSNSTVDNDSTTTEETTYTSSTDDDVTDRDPTTMEWSESGN